MYSVRPTHSNLPELAALVRSIYYVSKSYFLNIISQGKGEVETLLSEIRQAEFLSHIFKEYFGDFTCEPTRRKPVINLLNLVP